MTARHPIMVWCRHGIEGGEADPVQRYRWDDDQGKWIPSDNTAEGNTFVPKAGAAPKPGTVEKVSFEINKRQHYNARCKKCHRLVAMRENRAQIALDRLFGLGMTDPSIQALQHAYDAVPPMLR
jgi:hypothetical protein